jgi:hypothetical protein
LAPKLDLYDLSSQTRGFVLFVEGDPGNRPFISRYPYHPFYGRPEPGALDGQESAMFSVNILCIFWGPASSGKSIGKAWSAARSNAIRSLDFTLSRVNEPNTMIIADSTRVTANMNTTGYQAFSLTLIGSP